MVSVYDSVLPRWSEFLLAADVFPQGQFLHEEIGRECPGEKAKVEET
jgi:hypothetical protein